MITSDSLYVLYFQNMPIGLLKPEMAKSLPKTIFRITSKRVQIIEQSYFPQREIETWFKGYFLTQGLTIWRDELFSIFPLSGERAQTLGKLDRSIIGFLGIKGFGVHVNGYVACAGEIKMWISRRALSKKSEPGKLDQIVGGGMTSGDSAFYTMQKECMEEANITCELSKDATATSELSLLYEEKDEIRPDTLYCYDLKLPSAFNPKNNDGEVEQFLLLPYSDIINQIFLSGEIDNKLFKYNSALVMIDFGLRHSLIPDRNLQSKSTALLTSGNKQLNHYLEKSKKEYK